MTPPDPAPDLRDTEPFDNGSAEQHDGAVVYPTAPDPAEDLREALNATRNVVIVATAGVLRDWLPDVGSTDRAHVSEAIADATLAALPASSDAGLADEEGREWDLRAALDTAFVADLLGGPLESGEIGLLARHLNAALADADAINRVRLPARSDAGLRDEVVSAAVAWVEAHEAVTLGLVGTRDDTLLERYTEACWELLAIVSQNRAALSEPS